MRVLLVDDEDGLRRLLARVLTRSGFDVSEFNSASDALAWAAARAPDVLVTDVALEPVSGLELAESLLARYPGLPVVFISGYPTDIESFRSRHPAATFLLKPFPPKELAAAVAALAR